MPTWLTTALEWWMHSDIASVIRTLATLALLAVYLRARVVIRRQRIKLQAAHQSFGVMRAQGIVRGGVRYRLVPETVMTEDDR